MSTRDENGNIVVTLEEYRADQAHTTRLLRWCEENKVKLIARDEAGIDRIVTGYFPPSPEEKREQLRDAVIEAARAMQRSVNALADLQDTAANSAVAEEVMLRDVAGIVAAVDALEEHERGSGT